MDEIPPEIPAFGTRVIPSVFGGEQLMTMALYSYMAAISSDENRTLRFDLNFQKCVEHTNNDL